MNYGPICIILALVGAMFGTAIMHYMMIVTRRQSLIVIMLGIATAIASIILPFYSIYQTYGKIQFGEDMFQFNSFCETQ
jgi:hypothetical protein